MSAGKVDVLAVMARLVSSVNDDDIELDARADLHRDGTEARAAVAELIAADKEYDEARDTYEGKAPFCVGDPDNRTDEDYAPLAAAIKRRDAAIARIGGAA